MKGSSSSQLWACLKTAVNHTGHPRFSEASHHMRKPLTSSPIHTQRSNAARSRLPPSFHFSTASHRTSGSSSKDTRSSIYRSITLAGISAIALAVYARDPLLTEAGREREEKKKTKYIRLKDIKNHGADSPDGIWVSRGVSDIFPRFVDLASDTLVVDVLALCMLARGVLKCRVCRHERVRYYRLDRWPPWWISHHESRRWSSRALLVCLCIPSEAGYSRHATGVQDWRSAHKHH